MSDNGYVTRYGKATAKPGKGSELGALLVEAAEKNAEDSGCLQYEVNQAVGDPDTIWITEAWASEEAIQASLEDEDTKGLIEKARPLIEDMEMIELEPLGGLGAGPAEPKPGYTLKTFEDIPDQAPNFGMDDVMEAHFGAKTMELSQSGISHFRIKPESRQPFGHHHEMPEEVYVVIDGGGQVKLDDEIVELKKEDMLRVSPEIIRCFEAGPDGLEYLAFSQRFDGDGGLDQDWWQD